MEKRVELSFPGPFFEQACKVLLSFLLLALLGTIGAGIARTFVDLLSSLTTLVDPGGTEYFFRDILVDVLTVLALIEVFRTAMSYLVEGRVKVTYIIDTVLVALLTEVLAFWYREMDVNRMLMVIALVVSLMFVRIMAIRFSPKRRELVEGL
ncbi:phosphate-starvation-inducible PsiE family protein [Geothermobacter hydrogeniphilus]|uniref:Phosphate-starvation-inducible E n=1 Tax=Geothermobacter hydrogeniphilus TaxID=1969733 RepID=A0A1X0Y0F7_9BACT|nr:phosphate-starvation-inducible PsiE family protein [Geothermobacter hydrogeniphilus]ORJ58568.1 hypothetical protein B5V00_12020 [Geothermobacter hydrogeniphilus]